MLALDKYNYNPRTKAPWDLSSLTKEEVYRILELLYSPLLQQDIYINFNNPYRRFMPFLDQMELQAKFLAMYQYRIKELPHLEYRSSIIVPVR